MNIVDWLLQTNSGIAGLILRLTLAVVRLVAGWRSGRHTLAQVSRPQGLDH
jgi:hypothetical protein